MPDERDHSAAPPTLRVLALSPYHAGSHRAVFEGWRGNSRHAIDVWALPGRHWKWRMRHGAATFARRAVETLADPHHPRPDALVATSMLDLASFLGLARRALPATPAAVYMHENQLAYPPRPGSRADPRDAHFALTQLNALLAADAVWWNSAFNRDSFLDRLGPLLGSMPERSAGAGLVGVEERIASKSRVLAPGLDAGLVGPGAAALPPSREPGPLRLLWAARWEHDKAPDVFFDAIDELARRRPALAFELLVIGAPHHASAPAFESFRRRHEPRVRAWGRQAWPDHYRAALDLADVVVSTARHEFFGLAVAEATSRRCRPALPRDLAYPELYADPPHAALWHDNTPPSVVDRLETAVRLLEQTGSAWHDPADAAALRARLAVLAWPTHARAFDDALADLTTTRGSAPVPRP